MGPGYGEDIFRHILCEAQADVLMPPCLHTEVLAVLCVLCAMQQTAQNVNAPSPLSRVWHVYV